MNAVDFIKSDISKKTTTPFSYHLILYFFVFIFSLVYGYVSRDDLGATLRLNSLIASLLGFFVLIFALRKPRMWILALVLVLSIQTAILNPTGFSGWHGTLGCFLKGCLTTMIVGILLAGFAFKYSAWPNRGQRILLALSAGLSGSLMLEIHCDSSFLGHVLVGHVLQGVASGLVIFGIMELMFIQGVKKAFPHIEQPEKLG